VADAHTHTPRAAHVRIRAHTQRTVIEADKAGPVSNDDGARKADAADDYRRAFAVLHRAHAADPVGMPGCFSFHIRGAVAEGVRLCVCGRKVLVYEALSS
jgi:hypothetical protein